MNRNQKLAVAVGAGLFALRGVYPPLAGRYQSEYQHVFGMTAALVDIPMLLIQWAVIAVVTVGAYFWFKQ